MTTELARRDPGPRATAGPHFRKGVLAWIKGLSFWGVGR